MHSTAADVSSKVRRVQRCLVSCPLTTPSLGHAGDATVANDVVYFGSLDGKIYALDANNGAKAWEFATGNTVGSGPAVADGIVYVGSNDGNLYALRA